MAGGNTTESRALMIYPNHYAMLAALSHADQGRLLMALLDYSIRGEEPAFRGSLRVAFAELRGDVDRSIQRWEAAVRQRSEAGRRSAAMRAAKKFTEEVSCNDSSGGERPLNAAEDRSAPSTNQNQNSNQNQIQNQTQIQNQNNLSPSQSPGGRERDFEIFWQAYPRKVGKKAACRAYLRTATPPERILQALERQRADPQWQREQGRFIPHPATWLNQGRWEDEPGTSVSSDPARSFAGVETL